MSFQHKPTPEQEAIVEATERSADSLMIESLAGCAKTSSLELAGAKVKVPALALAFGKRNAQDMKERFAGNFSVKTMNGLGFAALLRGATGQVNIDDKKLGKLVTQVAKDRKVDLSEDQWASLRELANKAMQAGLVPAQFGQEGLVPDTIDSWQRIADSMLMTEDDFEFLREMAHETVVEDIKLARTGVISFDDQVYISSMLGGKFPKFPVVFVDEAQDLSPLNHRMLSLCCRPDGRIVAVGDSKQAIYKWRGADGSSMESIRRLRPGWKDLALATTFRCPKVVVARQQAHAPGYRAWHTNVDGAYRAFGRADQDDAPGAGRWSWAAVSGRARAGSVAILCRNNGPLLAMALKLLRQRVGVVMAGRDIGKGLVALAKKLCPEDGLPADKVLGLINDWQQSECSAALANENEEKVDGITDRAECLRAVLDGGEVRDAGELRSVLTKLFSRDSGAVTLSSIHRAKGLEWDTVIHLDPWRIPSKWARLAAQRGEPTTLQQEWNLLYVCETRTKHTLITADLGGFQ